MALRNPRGLPTPALRPQIVVPVVVVLVLVILLCTVGANTWVDLLFFREVGYSQVFTTTLATKVILFFVAGIFLAVGVGVNAVLAYRLRPPFRPTSLEQQSLDVYRRITDPYKVGVLILVTLGVGVIAGSAATGHWATVLAWKDGVSFGTKDAQFHKDVSFYVFTYPFLRFVIGILLQTVLLSILAAAAVHYFYGGIRLQTPGDKAVPAAKAHLSVLFGVLLLIKAWAYWLDRYGLNFSKRGFVDTGASWTDIHVVLPGKSVLVIVSLLCALLFFANASARGWTLPAVSVGLLIFAAVVVGGIVPAAVQHFSVKPNEITKEAPYISRNIAATQAAYKLTQDDVTVSNYDATQADATVAQADTSTLPNVRLLDPNILQPTFDQLQQKKNYYGFSSSLDIDRYKTADGVTREYVVAAREVNLDGLQSSQQNWINEHLVYTHGQGFVAAPSSQVDDQGQPVFTSPGTGNLPQSGSIPITQGRVYYGELAPAYSIVGTKQSETDGVSASGATTTNHYDGKGGVRVGGLLNKLAFALHFKASNLILNGQVDSSSKILYNRDPRVRVKKVAPFLTLDTDPYPAVVDGRIVWIVDGYTTSDSYPYSARTSLEDATADTNNTGSSASTSQQTAAQVNYIRNSVKAVVDAGDGTVTLYAWDATDPILRTWMKVFPGTIKPRTAMRPDLLEHVRYPEDLFKVQRALLAKYHVTDPQTFYQQGSFWSVPDDPTKTASVSQPPYYVLSQTPGESASDFNLTTTFNALSRPNLTAFLSVSSGPAASGGNAQDQYGHFTLLELPKEGDGVGQVYNKFNSSTQIGSFRTLLSGSGSAPLFGNLLTLPVGNGILYVEPVYVSGTGSTLHVLSKVLARYEQNIGFGGADEPPQPQSALTEALKQVFTGVGASIAPTGTTTPPTGSSASPSPGASTAPTSAPASADVTQLLQQLKDSQLRTDQLIQQLEQQLGSPSPSPSPAAATPSK